ncbi:MAG: response regulator transcription factor [Thermoleophilia bacterium]
MGNGANPSVSAAIDVLICDDNQPLLALLREVIGLRPSLRVVGEARDGNEAIVEARRFQPDIILLDLAMPRRTGLDALPELRQVAPAAKIIVFSGFSTASVVDEVLALGAARYLSKGADIDEINDAIEEVAAQAMSDPVVTGSVARE